MPGLNCFIGLHGLLTTSDPKRIIKHFATLIQSKGGIQVLLVDLVALHVTCSRAFLVSGAFLVS